jgi:hypothetical protein
VLLLLRKRDKLVMMTRTTIAVEFFRSKSNSKITEQTSSFTDDKYYCVVDGFGYPVLENILYCPYCGCNLVGH